MTRIADKRAYWSNGSSTQGKQKSRNATGANNPDVGSGSYDLRARCVKCDEMHLNNECTMMETEKFSIKCSKRIEQHTVQHRYCNINDRHPKWSEQKCQNQYGQTALENSQRMTLNVRH